MDRCILCLKQTEQSLLISIERKIDELRTVEEVIRENIECHFLILNNDISNQLVCNECFNCFKNFFELLSIVKNNYKITKVKDEIIDAFPINFCDISEPTNSSYGLQYETECKEEIKDSTENLYNENESYEWNFQGQMAQEFDEIDSNIKTKQKNRNTKIYSDDEDYEPNNKKKKYVRYIRKCDVTPEILASNKTYIVIDGVEYKIPRRPIKRWREKVEKPQKPINPERRPHGSKDPEGEEKIRNFVELKCHLCNEQFDAFWRLRKHYGRFHPGETAYVVCCNRKFTRRYTLLDHIEWHDRTKIHTCDICGKEYRSKTILQTHVNVVHLKIISTHELMCTQCGKIFKTTSALNKHQNVAHVENDGKTFECYICHRDSFKNEYTLQRHLKYLHDPESSKYKKTICHICSCILKVVSLKYHMRAKHSDYIQEKVKCEICEHWIMKTTMKRHMEKHKGNAGAECEICKKFFKNKTSVYKHKSVVHSTNYKYQCSYCDKKFHREVKMREHVAVRHTRDFLFKCRVNSCGREFRSEANWKIHEKKMHPEEYDKFFKPHYLRSPTRPNDSANTDANILQL